MFGIVSAQNQSPENLWGGIRQHGRKTLSGITCRLWNIIRITYRLKKAKKNHWPKVGPRPHLPKKFMGSFNRTKLFMYYIFRFCVSLIIVKKKFKRHTNALIYMYVLFWMYAGHMKEMVKCLVSPMYPSCEWCLLQRYIAFNTDSSSISML